MHIFTGTESRYISTQSMNVVLRYVYIDLLCLYKVRGNICLDYYNVKASDIIIS